MAKKYSDVFASIRYAKGEPRGKKHSSTDDEEHGAVGEIEWNQQLDHQKKRSMQEGLKDTCWKGYTAIGMKMKNGKKVPNCVPVKEESIPYVAVHAKKGKHETHGSTSYEAAQNAAKHWKMKNTSGISVYRADKTHSTQHVGEEVEQIDEMPGANMDTRAVHKHLRKSGWSLTRTKGSHDVYTHPKSEKHIAVPRHKQLKAPLVRGIMKDAQVSEEIEQIDEAFNKDKKHPRGGTVYVAVNQFHDGKGKYEVHFRPNKNSPRGRPKAQHISSHHDENEADKAKHEYAKKHGYEVMKPLGESVNESRGHKILATKLAQIEARKKREQEAAKRDAEEQKKKEPVKEEKKGSWQKDTGWKKDKVDTVDKSGAKHSAMSRVKHLAKMAAKRNVTESENDVEKNNTPAKRTLGKSTEIVKNVIKSKKSKEEKNDTFQTEPELSSQIIRVNY